MITDDDILQAKILIIDDQELNVRLLVETFRKAGYQNIFSAIDPHEGIELYKTVAPDLLVLDLNMPHLDGFQVMSNLKEIEGDSYLPIIILSGDESDERRLLALESGAKDLLRKPYDRIEVLIRIRNIIEVRLLHNTVRNQNKSLEQKVTERTREVYSTQLDVVQRLSRAIEYRDSETGLHIVRMSKFCGHLAKMSNLPQDQCDLIMTASPLHDIGKIGIPDHILRKPGKLTAEEWEIMKKHTTIGAELLSGGNSHFLKMSQEIALSHHEKWDGTGYPQGLKGEQIPLTGRICGICDVFDALTSKRPYKEAWPIEKAIEEIRNGQGKHFDPVLVDYFLKVLPEVLRVKEKYTDNI